MVTVVCGGNAGTHVLHALPTQAVARVELWHQVDQAGYEECV